MPPKPDQIHGGGQSRWPALPGAGVASERRKPQDGESRTQAQTRLLLGQRKGVWAALWGSWAVYSFSTETEKTAVYLGRGVPVS